MAKGQKRSNREAKKPKQPKPERAGVLPLAAALVPAGRERLLFGGRDQQGPRKGRR